MGNNNINESYAVLKIEIPSSKYNRSINVSIDDIESTVCKINQTCKELNIQEPRIYLSGFILSSMGNLTTNEVIITILSDIKNNIKTEVSEQRIRI